MPRPYQLDASDNSRRYTGEPRGKPVFQQFAFSFSTGNFPFSNLRFPVSPVIHVQRAKEVLRLIHNTLQNVGTATVKLNAIEELLNN